MRKFSNLVLSHKRYKTQKDYWINELSGIQPQSIIPPIGRLNRKLEPGKPPMQNRLEYHLESQASQQLIKLSKNSHITLFITLLSGFTVFLHKFTGKKDIFFSIPVFQEQSRKEPVNDMVILRIPIPGNLTFKEMLNALKETFVKAYENQDYPLDKIIEELSISNEESYETLLNLIFASENIHDTHSLSPVKNQLIVSFLREAQGIKFLFRFNPQIYAKDEIARIYKYFNRILHYMAADLSLKLSQLDILPEEEKNQLLNKFNSRRREYPRDKTIKQLFEEQVEKTPDNKAVVIENPGNHSKAEFKYRELNENANQLARLLRKKGVKPDNIIPLIVDRSLEMIIGIMGILKAGGAYLPIAPDNPLNRTQFMLKESQAALVIAKKQIVEGQAEALQGILPGYVIYPGVETDGPEDSGNLEPVNGPGNLAYVIYTSGSTGNPKGTMVEHRSLCNLVFGLHELIYQKYPGYLNAALVAPYVFDASIQQIFAVLLGGHCLYIVPDEYRSDGELLLEYFKNNPIDISDGTPAHLRLMTENREEKITGLHLKHLIIGGETLHKAIAARFLQQFASSAPVITNVYGPTECCVDSTFYDISTGNLDLYDHIPIGKPMPNVQVYILNSELKLQVLGIPGELTIGGDGVARGYLERRELTKEKYIPNPFKEGERLYRTNDIGRWLTDGNIQFLGRSDHQVKIRGYRIEPEEIQCQLTALDYINEAVVIDREEKNGVKYLCAYFVSDEEIKIEKIKNDLSGTLPDYMIPDYFMQIYKIPLTTNGKLARKSLPEPEIIAGEDYIAPRNEMERKLVEIWAEVLDIDKKNISIHDNFFQIGGHSLKAATLVSKVHKVFNVKVSLQEIFDIPTIGNFAKFIRSAAAYKYIPVETVEKKEYHRLSPAQKRVFSMQQMDEKSKGYNMPSLVELEGIVDRNRLEQTFIKLLERHESLRTSFRLVENEPVQKIEEKVDFEIEFLNSLYSPQGVEKILQGLIRPFDLSHAPLLRVKLIRIEEEKHLLTVDMHHIISDGISHHVLKNDFASLYKGEELSPLKLQYKDFSEWQNSERQRQNIEQQEAYWLKQLEGDISLLDLPTDYERPETRSFEGHWFHFEISAQETNALKALASEENTTLYMILAAIYNILLAKICNQEDIIMGTAAAGRRHVDLQDIIGIFVNTVVLRNYPEGKKSFREFLKEVTVRTLESFENQDYQFDELVGKLNIPREPGHNPLFDVMFESQNLDMTKMEIPGLKLKPYIQETFTSKFDLTLLIIETKETLSLYFNYNTKLFKKERIQQLSNYLIQIINAVIDDPRQAISGIEITSRQERIAMASLYAANLENE